MSKLSRGLRSPVICGLLILCGFLTPVMAQEYPFDEFVEDEFVETADPLEEFNRDVMLFNDELDRLFLKPIAKGYQAVMPNSVDRGITNFFANLQDFVIALNNLLQFKPKQASSDFGRILLNSTVGLLGFFDVASSAGLEKHNEDFGQTLGAWGVGGGPYVVLPLLGPSTIRDGFGLAFDFFIHPLELVENKGVRNSMWALYIVDLRADNLSTTRVLEQAALDRYIFIRDAYLQRRNFLIHDGNLPPSEGFMDAPMEPEPIGPPPSPE